MGTTVRSFAERVATKRALIDRHTEELKKLLKRCPHPEIVAKSLFYDATYYDREYTLYWNECVVCGMRSNQERS